MKVFGECFVTGEWSVGEEERMVVVERIAWSDYGRGQVRAEHPVRVYEFDRGYGSIFRMLCVANDHGVVAKLVRVHHSVVDPAHPLDSGMHCQDECLEWALGWT